MANSTDGIAYADKSRCPNKHLARKKAYAHLSQHQRAGYHIVIVGWIKDENRFTCDDIPALFGIGVRPAKIIACGLGRIIPTVWSEEMLTAAEWARKKYGVIASPHPLIQDTVSWANNSGFELGSINVDLCATLINTCPVVEQIVKNAKCLVIFTFSRFRDGMGMTPAGKSILGQDFHRDLLLREWLGRNPDWVWKYQSATPTSKGCPMCVAVFRRQYVCSKCKKLGQHPGTHKKVCSKQ